MNDSTDVALCSHYRIEYAEAFGREIPRPAPGGRLFEIGFGDGYPFRRLSIPGKIEAVAGIVHSKVRHVARSTFLNVLQR